VFNQLRRLYLQFKAQHFELSVPGFQLRTAKKQLIGNIERITLGSQDIDFQGWCHAERITVISNGGSKARVMPNITRVDVSDSIGGSTQAGFKLSAPYGNGRFTFTFECTKHDMPFLHVAPIKSFTLRKALLRFKLQFLKSLIMASPDILRWLILRQDFTRQRIKEVMGLHMLASKLALDPQLLPLDDAIAEVTDRPKIQSQPITILLPIYNAFDLLPEVLRRVVDHTDLPWRLILLEDCSSDPQVRPWLRAWVKEQNQAGFDQIDLMENSENLGFIRSVNRGLKRTQSYGDHVVLLNSDAFVPDAWASRLMAPIFQNAAVASTTPMSNDAEIYSVPVVCQRIDLQPGQGEAIDAIANALPLPEQHIDTPTGVGFCMGLNVQFLSLESELDTIFGRGYGEEVDWCQKVRAKGGRHVAVPNLFVEHRGGASFGNVEKRRLVQKNNGIVANRYPGYDVEVQDFIKSDPLITPRMALAVAWAASQAGTRAVPIYLAHSMGGGADLYLENKINADWATDRMPAIILRVGGQARWQIEVVLGADRCRGTLADFEHVQRLLKPIGRRHIVYSCGVGDRDPEALPSCLLALKSDAHSRLDLLVHDYFMISPTYTLLNDDGVFISPNSAARRQAFKDPKEAHLVRWRQAWRPLLVAADRVIAFSSSSRELVLSAYPEVRGKLSLQPHDLIEKVPRLAVRNLLVPRRRVVAVLGNIGFHKGAEVVCALGRMLDSRDDISLIVLGEVDPGFDWPKSIMVHGAYQLSALAKLVGEFQITDWLIPSIWPETFSYTTHEALATGLPTFAFDIGAQGEAVEEAPNGHVIPYEDGMGLAESILAELDPDHEFAEVQQKLKVRVS